MTLQARHSQGKKKYLIHFVTFSTILFLVILVVSSTAFLLSMRQIIRTIQGKELTRQLKIKQLQLESSVKGKIALATKMAESPLIVQFFADPANPEVKAMALREIDAYRKAFKGSKIFWVNDIDKIFYMDGAAPYVVDPGHPANYWYNMTLYETETYNFNINYNPDLNVTNLWVNAPVFDQEGMPIGMMGTGVDITEFIDDLYREHDDRASFYLFNSAGEITGAKNVKLVVGKEHIANEPVMVHDILAVAKELRPGETRTFNLPHGKAAVSTVPVLEWYSVAILPDSIDDYMNLVTAIFIVMLAIMALMTIIFNIFAAVFLKSLHKVMEALEATSRYKSEFLERMSHEILTPMNAILGMSELAQREQNIERVDGIKKASANLLTIIRNILDITKIESGRLEIILTDYSLPLMIDNVTSIVRTKIQGTQLKFRVDIDNRIPKALVGDEARISQVMINILSNAVKCTSEGYVSLAVKGTILDIDTVILHIEIADCGKGIRKDVERLICNFEQLSKIGNKNIEDTSIALSITYDLVEAMGGNIAVQLEPDRGYTFTVTLPQGISRNVSLVDEKAMSLFKAPDAKVLVVDDVFINLAVAKGLLAIYEVQIDTCSDGEEAVAAVQTKEYDLVFMDHMMPIMDGIKATTMIRGLNEERFQRLPIIALTASSVPSVEEMFLNNGFSDYLSKPIIIQRLHAVLEKWIPAEKQKMSVQETKVSQAKV
jgi:signal transduction histidine kinase/CheY-like chemotaxis protein